ncbi:MAG TPA: hypothetical protein VFQ77_14215 [Pseudonocardiaceae bacterium]|nr:hypothetical protein [Pseudonocardiaceae bacterium]
MGKHEDASIRDGQKGDYDHANTKDVTESGGGKHDKDDTADQDEKDDK